MHLKSEELKKIKLFFSKKPVLKAFLFGSYARKSANASSDIDILVELDYNQKIGLEFIGMKLDLENILNRPVDLVSSRSIFSEISSFVESDKILIYKKET